MATYIDTSDITDKVINDLGTTVVSAKVTASDDAVEDLAQEKGVAAADIDTDPVAFLVKKWAIAWTCYELCKDFLGSNNLESLDQEKYAVKGKLYFDELADYYGRINENVLTGTVSDKADRATVQTGTIYRSS